MVRKILSLRYWCTVRFIKLWKATQNIIFNNPMNMNHSIQTLISFNKLIFKLHWLNYIQQDINLLPWRQ